METRRRVLAMAMLMAAGTAGASDLQVPNTFQSGSKAVAAEVNANFAAAETAVNDNDARLTALDTRVSTLEGEPATRTRSVLVPAGALSFNDTWGMAAHSDGLLMPQDYRGEAGFTLAKPEDYAGGDVTLKVVFRTTTGNSGYVHFFARPRSFAAGDPVTDAASLDLALVQVAGEAIHETSVEVPAARLGQAIWYFTLQREGASSTYADDIVLNGVSLEYDATR